MLFAFHWGSIRSDWKMRRAGLNFRVNSGAMLQQTFARRGLRKLRSSRLKASSSGFGPQGSTHDAMPQPEAWHGWEPPDSAMRTRKFYRTRVAALELYLAVHPELVWAAASANLRRHRLRRKFCRQPPRTASLSRLKSPWSPAA